MKDTIPVYPSTLLMLLDLKWCLASLDLDRLPKVLGLADVLSAVRIDVPIVDNLISSLLLKEEGYFR